MPKHERAPSGHDAPRLNRTSEEMMADFAAKTAKLRVVDYLAGSTPDQLAMLPDSWRPRGIPHKYVSPPTDRSPTDNEDDDEE